MTDTKQKIFDDIIFLVLTTVSCEEYLKHYNIYRHTPIKNWDLFKHNLNMQILHLCTIKTPIFINNYCGYISNIFITDL